MSLTVVEFTLPCVSRAQMREDLTRLFLAEQPGTGKNENTSRYRYNVEKFGDRYCVFLKRPTRLNKGFDFTVNVEGLYFRNVKSYSNPSHKDVVAALKDCQNRCPEIYESEVKPILRDVYDCKPVRLNAVSDAKFIDFENRLHPIAVILLTVKWLFMEQDCAYWNYSGRAMFYERLQSENLV